MLDALPPRSGRSRSYGATDCSHHPSDQDGYDDPNFDGYSMIQSGEMRNTLADANYAAWEFSEETGLPVKYCQKHPYDDRWSEFTALISKRPDSHMFDEESAIEAYKKVFGDDA